MGPRTAVTPSKGKMVTGGGHCSRPRGSRCGGGYYSRRDQQCPLSPPAPLPVLHNPKSVLKRPVSPEELQKPGSRFVKRTFTIVGDAVGWGFVVRGSQPCHIQAVEPSGPAAAAGMKVCQFVVAVNGVNVVSLDYKTVSSLILTGPRTVVMEIMEEADC